MAFFKKKDNKYWIWKAYDRDRGELIDWECGNRDTATLKRLVKRFKEWNIEVYCTDEWAPYVNALPVSQLVQSKAETVSIERNNSDNRHWFARFRRRTKVVSISEEMVNLTMGLFATYHVNGTMTSLIDQFFNELPK